MRVTPVPGLRGVSDVVVTTDEFAPLYRRGDVVFLDSSVALTPGDECVFCARNGDVKIARLLRVEAGCWVVRGYSAATEERLSRKEWPEGAFVDAGYVGRHWTRESARQAYKVHWHAEHAAAAEA